MYHYYEHSVSQNYQDEPQESLDSLPSQPPIVNLANKILAQAVRQGASHIHIESQENCLRVRYRLDGVLYPFFGDLPRKLIPAMISRLKLMAQLEVTEKSIAQTGQISRYYEGRKVDFRAEFIPTRWGENVIIECLDKAKLPSTLEQLIFNPSVLEKLRSLVHSPSGLLICLGSQDIPLGYVMLEELKNQDKGFAILQTKLSYELENAIIMNNRQVFLSLSRSSHYRNFDIILVDGIEDPEIAKTAIHLARSGCLVIAILPYRNMSCSLAKLSQVDPVDLSEVLIGIVNQVVIRCLCANCRRMKTYPATQLTQFGLSASKNPLNFYRGQCLTYEEKSTKKASGELCLRCEGRGYKGQMGLYDIITITPHLRSLIRKNISPNNILYQARQEGMISALNYGLEMCQMGHTSLEELERVSQELKFVEPVPEPIVAPSFSGSISKSLLVKRLIQLEILHQQTEKNLKLSVDHLQKQLLMMQKQLTALTRPNQKGTSSRSYPIPPDPWD